MRTVKEVSELTGVSVRALHHYDAIGLLRPTEVSKTGYRLYDDSALVRLQSILLFRELQFPLKEIKAILDSPNFNQPEALAQQIEMCELQRQHLDRLISFARDLQQKGITKMGFDVFDKAAIERYKAEAKAKWGDTAAYREFEQKQVKESDQSQSMRLLMDLFCRLGEMKHLPPSHEEVQAGVGELQAFITERYYHCSDDILRGLGQLYVQDERFRSNIDSWAGEGTAEFVSQAIRTYCSKR